MYNEESSMHFYSTGDERKFYMIECHYTKLRIQQLLYNEHSIMLQ